MRIALLAKSPWEPAIRREHAFCLSAPTGTDLVFVESPADVRSVRSGGRVWARHLFSTVTDRPVQDVTRLARSTPAPGHRGPSAARVDCLLLRRQIREIHRRTPLDAVVVQQPWQWAAVQGLPVRRVFDAADDWTVLIPQREVFIRGLYRRIAREADAVVVAAPTLGRLFPGAEPVLVPNGVDPALSRGAPTLPPGRHRLGYLGTLTERFDAPFVAELMDRLPGWGLDLFGACHYAGCGDAPSPELSALLARPDGRIRWHGPVARKDVLATLDAADVLLIPNRAERSAGQSSMKMLDYASRGRPVVSTRWDSGLEERLAPGTALVDSAAQAAVAVVAAAREPVQLAAQRVTWAREGAWQTRWPAWAAAVLGQPVVTRKDPLPPSPRGGGTRFQETSIP